jgi:exportin-2 (importin alpha re-exporter)
MLKPFIKPLLQGLFSVFKKDDSSENEYAMKAIMRLCAAGEDLLAGVAGLVIAQVGASRDGCFCVVSQPQELCVVVVTLRWFNREYICCCYDQVTKILMVVAKNPRNPHFNHYLFETVACLVTNVCKADKTAIGSFEKALFGPFQQVA